MQSASKWSTLAALALCGVSAVLLPAQALPQPQPGFVQSQADTPPAKPAAEAAPKTDQADAPGTTRAPTGKAPAVKKPAARVGRRPVATHRRAISPRVRRMRQAFVASASLRPMAQQLLQDRSLAAYAGVEAYARAHAKEDAGALAWLVVGYAHVLDREFAKAIDPLSRAKVHAGDLGDYVDYYLGTSYLQTGRTAEALATLSDFAKNHPDSLLVRDADVSYSGALLAEGQAAEAVTLLAQDRTPVRSDVELALGRAYAATGQTAKAAEIFANIYYTMPASADADAAYAELRKLPSVPPATASQLKTRADGLM
ncbi:MAG: tetratricopeptide repeat protein, partial [Candidatus Sulfotelmatobacter sp.]